MKKTILIIAFLALALTLTIIYGEFHLNNQSKSTNAVKPEQKTDDDYQNGKIFVYGLNEKFNVYIENGEEDSRYIGYKIGHFKEELNKEEPSSNYDVWKLNGAASFERTSSDNFKHLSEIVRTGEWEMAIRESGVSDFIGGTAHGDEITTSVELYIDGKEHKTSDFLELEADELKLVTISDLYRDNTITDELEIVGTHHKEYVFNNDGLTLNQEVKFNQEMSLLKSYLTMLPILREKDGKQITDSFFIDGEEHEVKDENNFDIVEHKTDKATIKGNESGVEATVEILDKGTDSDTNLFVTNSPLYNKLYFSYVDDGYEVEEGETWSQTTHYKIGLTK